MPFFLVTREDLRIGDQNHEGVIVGVQSLPTGMQHLVAETRADVVISVGEEMVEIFPTASTDPDGVVFFPSFLFGDDASLGSMKAPGIQLTSFVLGLSPDRKDIETFLYFLRLSKPTMSLEWHKTTPQVATLASLV